MQRALRLVLLALATSALAACEPSLPQPFRPASVPPLTEPGIRAGLVVAPVEGAADGSALAKATADALQTEDIAATTDPLESPAYRLTGRAVTDARGVRIDWTVKDAAGSDKGTATQQLTAADVVAWRTGDPSLYQSLAATAAHDIAGAISESKSSQPERPLIAIPEVTGAPGDGPRTLQRSMAYVLGKRGFNITESTQPESDAGLVLLGSMHVVKGKDHSQVEVAWTLIRPDGQQVGTVSQANDVPAGLFDAPWGDIAYTIAESAADSVVQLVNQAGAPAESGGVTAR